MTQKLLEISDLHTSFHTDAGTVNALRGVNLTINESERVGLVGESGSGKSVTAQSVLRLVDSPGEIVDGSIELNGRDLLSLSESQMQSVRGRDITMIFQDPSTSLDPVYSIRSQMIEKIGHNRNMSDAEAESVAIKYLEKVDMPNPERILDSYPHELSGGMKQRVSIAMALGFDPDLIIADEPTTALDVTVQKRVIDIFREVVNEEDVSVLWITHNLGVVAEFCDKIGVIYAGELVEYGSVYDIFDRPTHPYTRELLQTIPNIERADEELRVIEGTVPNMREPPSGCAFHPRCPDAEKRCETTHPDEIEGRDHQASCLVHDTEDK